MKTFKRLLLENLTIILYFISAIILELVGAKMTDGHFFIKDPRYLFSVIGLFVCILIFIKNQYARVIVMSSFLLIQGVLNVGFVLLFEMSGQWFDFSMFSLRHDAMGILENVPINFWLFFGVLVLISAFVIFGIRYAKYVRNNVEETSSKKSKIITLSVNSLLVMVLIGLNILTAYSLNGKTIDKYNNLLYSTSSSKYNQYGITGNVINELYSSFSPIKEESEDSVENFIYNEDNIYRGGSIYSGISKGNNVITILGETLEWFSFMSKSAAEDKLNLILPNGTKLTEEECRELYPNFWYLYDNSYVMTNYHAREKTDISENYSILGSYPMETFINYDYCDNVLPQSMPKMLKTIYGDDLKTQYFHNGYADFYNREVSIPNLGFDNWYTTEKILNLDGPYKDYGANGERNLDSEMVLSCADLMFPTDKQFYTYITTISMHGMYSKKRGNLEKQGYYDKLRKFGMDIDDPNLSKEDFIYYSYLACALDTDKALGYIFTELNNRVDENGVPLIENTTLVLFGDHQAYYEGLSSYVKNILNADDCVENDMNYMDLYRVPLMIFDKKLVKKATEESETGRFNDKFSSSCDIVPTLLDLLGINYYGNIYYGHSLFSDTESLVYSRGYGYFLSNYAYFYNINNFMYLSPKLDDKKAYINYLESQGKVLIEKIRYIDSSYKLKYFNNKAKEDLYKSRLLSIQ